MCIVVLYCITDNKLTDFLFFVLFFVSHMCIIVLYCITVAVWSLYFKFLFVFLFLIPIFSLLCYLGCLVLICAHHVESFFNSNFYFFLHCITLAACSLFAHTTLRAPTYIYIYIYIYTCW